MEHQLGLLSKKVNKLSYDLFTRWFIFVQIKLKIMDLFAVTNGKAMPSVHALIIEPFKTIWKEDTDPTKGNAIRDFTFIELCCSPKKTNPYVGYDEEQRYQILKEELYGDPAYVLSNNVLDGIIKYEQLLDNYSPTLSLLKAALDGAEKFKTQMKKLNLDARTNSGAAVYKPRDITNAMKDLPQLAKDIEALREKVFKELLEEGKTRSNRTIGYFEE